MAPRFAYLAVAAVAGCANYSQLQDAETLPKGEQRIGVGASFTRYTGTATDADGQEIEQSFSVPAIVVWARRGVTERLEAQVTAWLPMGARGGVKYMVLGEADQPGFTLSAGPSLGYLRLSVSSGDSEADVGFFDVYLPVYAGWRFSPSFAVYAAPQYIYRTVFGEVDENSGHVTGGTLGVSVGKKARFHVEAGTFYDTLVEAPIFNTALGVSL
jgi:hypothetical protein